MYVILHCTEFSYEHDLMLQSRQVVTILANLSVLEQCTADVLEEKGMCAKHPHAS